MLCSTCGENTVDANGMACRTCGAQVGPQDGVTADQPGASAQVAAFGYATPPARPLGAPLAAEARLRAPQGVAGFATALTVLIGAMILAMAAAIVVFGLRYQLAGDLAAGSASLADADTSDHLVQATATLCIVLFLASAIVYLCWLFRTRANTETWGGSDHHFGRGWAIGGWFLPIGNFWIPFRVVTDVHRNSVPATTRRSDVPQEFRVWWGFFIAAGLLNRINPSTDTPDGVKNDALVSIAYFAALIAAAVFALLVVRRITRAQTERIADWHAAVARGASPLGLLVPAPLPGAPWSQFGPQ